MSPSPQQLEQIARRAARRALAERGLAHSPADSRGSGAGEPHVHVHQAGGSPPPGAPRALPARSGPVLIDGQALAGAAPGEPLSVPHGALVTPLARDEAHRRGVPLVAESGTGAVRAPLRVAVGCDHGGFALKADVLTSLRELGARTVDFGTRDSNAVDYPDVARAVAEAVAAGQCDLGVVIDGAGIGSAIAANKVPGVRAATCVDERMARNAREHNHANVLSIGTGWLDASRAHGVLRAFLTTDVGPGRHARRVAIIDSIEGRYARTQPRTQAHR